MNKQLFNIVNRVNQITVRSAQKLRRITMNTHQYLKRILLLGAYVFTGTGAILQAQGIEPDSTQLAAFKAFNRDMGIKFTGIPK